MHSPIDTNQQRLCTLQAIDKHLLYLEEALVDLLLAYAVQFDRDRNFLKAFFIRIKRWQQWVSLSFEVITLSCVRVLPDRLLI